MKTRVRMLILIVLSMAVLYGCATAYQPKGITGGYSDRQVSEDEFVIEFDGNGHTTQGRAAEFALMRCADICLQHRFGYFKIVKDRIETNVSYYQHPGSATTFGSFRKGRYYSSTSYTPPSVTEIRAPSVAALIKCYVSQPSDGVLGQNVFDARHIQALGRKKYGLE